MTQIEILASRLAESVLMDWDKEQQVDLAQNLAVELLKKASDERQSASETKSSGHTPDPFPTVVTMYGVQVKPFRNLPVVTTTTEENYDNSTKI